MDLAITFGPLVVSVLAAVVALGCAAFMYAHRPLALTRRVDGLHDQVRAFESKEADREADRLAMLQAVERIHEQVEDTLQAVEKKRRRAAANASRANGEPEFDPNDRAQLESLARSRGMLE